MSYVGLSGGFGTLTIGQIWSATYNSVGAITDNSNFLGDSETSGRHGNVVSYAVSVENMSIQVDVTMNKGEGGEGAQAIPASHNHTINGGRISNAVTIKNTNNTIVKGAAVDAVPEDKNVDAMEIGVSMGLGENGKIAFAHKNHDTAKDVQKKSNYIAGQYSIGAMTAFLGIARHNTTAFAAGESNAGDIQLRSSQKISTTFAGVRGSVGDTGVSYLFQARSKKAEGTELADSGEVSLRPIAPNKHTTWMLGLSKSLGGGASVHFEHSDPDQKDKKSTSFLALKVDF